MRVQLHWVEVKTGMVRTPTLETPVAFGREFGSMPSTVEGVATSRMVLASDQVEAYHALLTEQAGQLTISDRGSRHCTQVNGVALPMQPVQSGDRITIGPFEITVTVLEEENYFVESGDSSPHPAVSHPSQPVASDALTANATLSAAVMGVAAVSSGSSPVNPPGSGTGSLPTGFGSDGRCDRKVGFLFKRRCGRTTTAGCPDCRNGQLDPQRDRYADDYAYYPDYGNYGHGRWGHRYYHHRHAYYYDSDTRNVDFNESDVASFEQEGDRDYEMDLDAS
jgi:hypothetical protein